MVLLFGVLVLLVSLETWNQAGKMNSPLSGVSVLLPLAALTLHGCPSELSPLQQVWQPGDAEGASWSPTAEEGWNSSPSVGTHPCHLRCVTWLIGRSCVHERDKFRSCILPSACPPPVWLFDSPSLTDLSS